MLWKTRAGRQDRRRSTAQHAAARRLPCCRTGDAGTHTNRRRSPKTTRSGKVAELPLPPPPAAVPAAAPAASRPSKLSRALHMPQPPPTEAKRAAAPAGTQRLSMVQSQPVASSTAAAAAALRRPVRSNSSQQQDAGVRRQPSASGLTLLAAAAHQQGSGAAQVLQAPDAAMQQRQPAAPDAARLQQLARDLLRVPATGQTAQLAAQLALQSCPVAAERPTAKQMADLEWVRGALRLRDVGSILLGWRVDRRFCSWLASLPLSWRRSQEPWLRMLYEEGQWAVGLPEAAVQLVSYWVASKAEAHRGEVARSATVAAAAAAAAAAAGAAFSVADVCRLEALILMALEGDLYSGFKQFLAERGLQDFAG